MIRKPRGARFDVDRAFERASDSFIADMKSLIQKAARQALEQALSENANRAKASAAVPSPPVGSPEVAASSRNGSAGDELDRLSKREQEAVEKLTDRLLEYIEATPGQRYQEICEGLGVSGEELELPMKILVRENHLRLVGEEPSAAYYAR